VEAAFVLPALILVLFGLFEYCRFIFLLQVAENAAREGARYAVVHTGDGTTLATVQSQVTNAMYGRDKELSGMTVTVEAFDSAGNLMTNWNDAGFGQIIRVRISGTYNPAVPALLRTSSSITVRATATMNSEGN